MEDIKVIIYINNIKLDNKIKEDYEYSKAALINLKCI